MSWFVYILHSEKMQKFYIGTTDNVENRLIEHNQGKHKNSFTKRGIPWILYLEIICSSSKQAYNLEKFIKQMKSSVFIKRLKQDHNLLQMLIEKYSV